LKLETNLLFVLYWYFFIKVYFFKCF